MSVHAMPDGLPNYGRSWSSFPHGNRRCPHTTYPQPVTQISWCTRTGVYHRQRHPFKLAAAPKFPSTSSTTAIPTIYYASSPPSSPPQAGFPFLHKSTAVANWRQFHRYDPSGECYHRTRHSTPAIAHRRVAAASCYTQEEEQHQAECIQALKGRHLRLNDAQPNVEP